MVDTSKISPRTIILLTDRSRIVDYEECHRKRLLGYHFPIPLKPGEQVRPGGTGIAPEHLNMYLHDGICTHHGLANMLLGNHIDYVVTAALQQYWFEVNKRGLTLEPGEDPAYVAKEQAALVEAMLRAYYITRLPELLKRFTVLEVEVEELWPLADFTIPGRIVTDVPPGINAHDPAMKSKLVIVKNEPDTRVIVGFQSRLDALLLDKETDDLYVQSYKTSKQWDNRTDKQNQHDMQGLSEIASVEIRLERLWHQIHDGPVMPPMNSGLHPELYRVLKEAPQPPKIQGVRMEYLLKGARKRKQGDESGPKIQHSPLIRGWRNMGVTPGSDQFAWAWDWKDEMGKKRTLNWQHWKPFSVWEVIPGGVKQWVEEMLAPDAMGYSHIQPEAGSCLEQQFVCPMPYMRQDDDMRNWYQQTKYQEAEVAKQVLLLLEAIQMEGWYSATVQTLLNHWFPQYRRSCDWPDACEFTDVCFSVAIGKDPLGSGMFRARLPHHKPEEEQFAGKAIHLYATDLQAEVTK